MQTLNKKQYQTSSNSGENMSNLLQTYNPLPVYFESADGPWLFDDKGKKYLDCICGIGVTNIGHNNKAVIDAIKNQAEKILHTSNLVKVKQQEQLADKLNELSGINAKCFFANSGAEALEAAIKLARLYGHSKNIDSPKIIVMERAFHGRTMACITASGSKKIQEGFEPLLDGFVRVPFNDPAALDALSNDKDIAAVLLEPIQGEGGINIPDAGYLKKVREICDKNSWLMILDEVQAGIGRTGKMFCYQHDDIKPDAVTLAKGLGNGIPIGAIMVKDKYAGLFKPGSHGTTFGGNPLSSSVALAVLNEIESKNLAENAAKKGKILLDKLKETLKDNSHVVNIRGKGLMIGIELDKPCRGILKHALEHGILFNITRDTTIRLLCPLIIENEHIDYIIKTIPVLIEKFYAE